MQGARENNLKDVSVEIPKRRPTVFTGVATRSTLTGEHLAAYVGTGPRPSRAP